MDAHLSVLRLLTTCALHRSEFHRQPLPKNNFAAGSGVGWGVSVWVGPRGPEVSPRLCQPPNAIEYACLPYVTSL